jgi:hypothetical protein
VYAVWADSGPEVSLDPGTIARRMAPAGRSRVRSCIRGRVRVARARGAPDPLPASP